MALNRALRKLNEYTVNIYSNFTQIFIFLAIVLALDQKADIFMEFDLYEWLLMVGASLFQVLSAIYLFKASQTLPMPIR